MLHAIKVNLEAVEAMLYFWQATLEKEKTDERFIHDVGNMAGYTSVYDEDFDFESLRRALSALTNREIFSAKNRNEGRFYNNNLWMMEDMEYTNAMVQPIKKLNLDALIASLPKCNFETIEVYFVPLHLEDYYIKGNRLIINFFKVKPSLMDDQVFIGEQEILEFIQEKLIELLNK